MGDETDEGLPMIAPDAAMMAENVCALIVPRVINGAVAERTSANCSGGGSASEGRDSSVRRMVS